MCYLVFPHSLCFVASSPCCMCVHGKSDRECKADVRLLWSSGPRHPSEAPRGAHSLVLHLPSDPSARHNVVLHSNCADFPSVFLQGLVSSRAATPSDSRASHNTSHPPAPSTELAMPLKQVSPLRQGQRGTIPLDHHRLAYNDHRPI